MNLGTQTGSVINHLQSRAVIGLLVDESTNWRYWERGRQARILCDEANQSTTTPK